MPSFGNSLPEALRDRAEPGQMLDGPEITDMNRDVMSIELTVKRNCGPELVPAFYEACGPVEADPERMRFSGFWTASYPIMQIRPLSPAGCDALTCFASGSLDSFAARCVPSKIT